MSQTTEDSSFKNSLEKSDLELDSLEEKISKLDSQIRFQFFKNQKLQIDHVLDLFEFRFLGFRPLPKS